MSASQQQIQQKLPIVVEHLLTEQDIHTRKQFQKHFSSESFVGEVSRRLNTDPTTELTCKIRALYQSQLSGYAKHDKNIKEEWDFVSTDIIAEHEDAIATQKRSLTLPSMPGLSALPEMPALPVMPALPQMPAMPQMPQLPNIRNLIGTLVAAKY